MRGFIVPELIIESIIRDGIQNVNNDPTIIDDLFAQLTRTYSAKKYGQTEIDKIKEMVKKEIAVVYTYSQIDQFPISFSIMIGSDTENARGDSIDDYLESAEEQIVDADELQALHKVDDLEVLDYDPISGKVSVSDATDLTSVYRYMIYTDASENEFTIINAVSNEIGNKFFFIEKGSEPDYSENTGFIRSNLDYKEYEVKGIRSNVKMVVGAHSKDVLTTKWMYVLLKYFIVSRKKDIIKRGLICSMVDGSDFARDSDFEGDKVFTRFLTISGQVDDIWRSDQVQLIDHIEIDAKPGNTKQTSRA